MTRMTLDSIGMAGFGYDFKMINNKENPTYIHPFVTAMVSVLDGVQKQNNRNPIMKLVKYNEVKTQCTEARNQMNETIADLVKKRGDSGVRRPDILDLMLNAQVDM
jgi:cytochrome P450/NADPH-cytochrome P450 reductase